MPDSRNILNISCREATRLASESHERALTFLERAALVFHNVLCIVCRRWVAQIQFIHEIMRLYGQGAGQEFHLGARLSDETKNRIKDALRREMA